MTQGEAIQAAIDSQAKIYYEADIRVQQGEDPEKVARDLGLDKIENHAGVKIGGALFIPIEGIIGGKVDEKGRAPVQQMMSEGAEKQYLESTLTNLEKANEKLKVVNEKKRNLFVVVGCVIGLFFLIGSKD